MKHPSIRRPAASGLVLRLAIAGVILALTACGGGGGTATGPSQPQGPSYAGPVTVALPEDGRSYWMAYQDGDGAWTLAQRTATGFTFQVNNTAGKYGLVLVSEDPQGSSGVGPRVNSLFFTRQEVPSLDLTVQSQMTATVFFNISGAPAASGEGAVPTCFVGITNALKNLGHCSTSGGSYTYLNTYAGTSDVFLTHVDGTGQADLIMVKRDEAISHGKTLNFDFAAASRLSATQQSRLVNDAPVAGETVSYTASYNSSTSRARLSQAAQRTVSYGLVPDALRRPTDFYSVGATATLDQNGAYARRSSTYRSLSGKGQDLQLPTYVNPIVVGLVPGANAPRPALRWTPLKGSLMSDLEVFSDSPMLPEWYATFSAGWMGGQAQMSYNFPDLSALGWKPTWYLSGNQDLNLIYVERSTSNPDKGFYLYKQREKLVDEVNWTSDISAPLVLR